MAQPLYDWQPSDAEFAFLPLQAAAVIAYFSVIGSRVGEPIVGLQLERGLDMMANALASVATVYTVEPQSGIARPVTRTELMLARFAGGGERLVRKDNSTALGELRMRWIDLAAAIEQLRAPNVG